MISEAWIKWARETLYSSLIVRIDLTKSEDRRPGSERISASILCRHYDDDGPVVGELFYHGDSRLDRSKVELSFTSEEWHFEALLRSSTMTWPKLWCNQVPVSCWAHDGPASNAKLVPASNMIILQHLGFLRGIVNAEYRASEAVAHSPKQVIERRALLQTMTNRLQGLVANGNYHWQGVLADVRAL